MIHDLQSPQKTNIYISKYASHGQSIIYICQHSYQAIFKHWLNQQRIIWNIFIFFFEIAGTW